MRTAVLIVALVLAQAGITAQTWRKVFISADTPIRLLYRYINPA